MPDGSKPDALPAGVDAPLDRGRALVGAIRFRHFRHFLALPLASVDLARPSLTTALALARGVIIAFLLLAFGYLANGVGDRGMDVDPEKNPLAQRPALDDRRFDLPLAALAAAAVALAATGPLPVLIASACCLLSGFLYSLGPRLKAKPLIGTLLNASNFAPLLFLGLEHAAPPPRLALIVPAFVALLLENQLLHEAADAGEDRDGGLRTTFLAVGPAGTALLAALAGAAVLAITLRILGDRGLSPALAVHAAPHLLVFPALLLAAGRSPARMARARVAQRWAAAASGALLVALTL